jgi:hypothetical protein
MNPFPPPRAYVDWKVPIRSDGSLLASTEGKVEYYVYISWLANYLYEADIPVPKCQEELCGFPCFIPDEFDPFAFEDFENKIMEGLDYQAYYKLKTEQWNEYYKELKEQFPDSDESDETSNKKYFFDVCVATEEQFNRVGMEIAERRSKGVPAEITHADIPYRAVFSRTLKLIPSHSDRVSALNAFYDKYSREMDKVLGK